MGSFQVSISIKYTNNNKMSSNIWKSESDSNFRSRVENLIATPRNEKELDLIPVRPESIVVWRNTVYRLHWQ